MACQETLNKNTTGVQDATGVVLRPRQLDEKLLALINKVEARTHSTRLQEDTPEYESEDNEDTSDGSIEASTQDETTTESQGSDTIKTENEALCSQMQPEDKSLPEVSKEENADKITELEPESLPTLVESIDQTINGVPAENSTSKEETKTSITSERYDSQEPTTDNDSSVSNADTMKTDHQNKLYKPEKKLVKLFAKNVQPFSETYSDELRQTLLRDTTNKPSKTASLSLNPPLESKPTLLNVTNDGDETFVKPKSVPNESKKTPVKGRKRKTRSSSAMDKQIHDIAKQHEALLQFEKPGPAIKKKLNAFVSDKLDSYLEENKTDKQVPKDKSPKKVKSEKIDKFEIDGFTLHLFGSKSNLSKHVVSAKVSKLASGKGIDESRGNEVAQIVGWRKKLFSDVNVPIVSSSGLRYRWTSSRKLIRGIRQQELIKLGFKLTQQEMDTTHNQSDLTVRNAAQKYDHMKIPKHKWDVPKIISADMCDTALEAIACVYDSKTVSACTGFYYKNQNPKGLLPGRARWIKVEPDEPVQVKEEVSEIDERSQEITASPQSVSENSHIEEDVLSTTLDLETVMRLLPPDVQYEYDDTRDPNKRPLPKPIELCQPTAEDAKTPSCGRDWCQLGCVCDSLQRSSHRTVLLKKHCGQAMCVLGCSCKEERRRLNCRHKAIWDGTIEEDDGRFLDSSGKLRSSRTTRPSLAAIAALETQEYFDTKKKQTSRSNTPVNIPPNEFTDGAPTKAGFQSARDLVRDSSFKTGPLAKEATSQGQKRKRDSDDSSKEAPGVKQAKEMQQDPDLEKLDIRTLLDEINEEVSCARTVVYVPSRLRQHNTNTAPRYSNENIKALSKSKNLPTAEGITTNRDNFIPVTVQKTDEVSNLMEPITVEPDDDDVIDIPDSQKKSLQCYDINEKKKPKLAKKKEVVQMVLLKRKTTHLSNIPHLLEVHSNCNWESVRQQLLSRIGVLADYDKGYPPVKTFSEGEFNVSIMKRARKAMNIPSHLRSVLQAETTFPIRVRVDVIDDEQDSQDEVNSSHEVGGNKEQKDVEMVLESSSVSKARSRPTILGGNKDKASETPANTAIDITAETSTASASLARSFQLSGLSTLNVNTPGMTKLQGKLVINSKKPVSTEGAEVSETANRATDVKHETPVLRVPSPPPPALSGQSTKLVPRVIAHSTVPTARIAVNKDTGVPLIIPPTQLASMLPDSQAGGGPRRIVTVSGCKPIVTMAGTVNSVTYAPSRSAVKVHQLPTVKPQIVFPLSSVAKKPAKITSPASTSQPVISFPTSTSHHSQKVVLLSPHDVKSSVSLQPRIVSVANVKPSPPKLSVAASSSCNVVTLCPMTVASKVSVPTLRGPIPTYTMLRNPNAPGVPGPMRLSSVRLPNGQQVLVVPVSSVSGSGTRPVAPVVTSSGVIAPTSMPVILSKSQATSVVGNRLPNQVLVRATPNKPVNSGLPPFASALLLTNKNQSVGASTIAEKQRQLEVLLVLIHCANVLCTVGINERTLKHSVRIVPELGIVSSDHIIQSAKAVHSSLVRNPLRKERVTYIRKLIERFARASDLELKSATLWNFYLGISIHNDDDLLFKKAKEVATACEALAKTVYEQHLQASNYMFMVFMSNVLTISMAEARSLVVSMGLVNPTDLWSPESNESGASLIHAKHRISRESEGCRPAKIAKMVEDNAFSNERAISPDSSELITLRLSDSPDLVSKSVDNNEVSEAGRAIMDVQVKAVSSLATTQWVSASNAQFANSDSEPEPTIELVSDKEEEEKKQNDQSDDDVIVTSVQTSRKKQASGGTNKVLQKLLNSRSVKQGGHLPALSPPRSIQCNAKKADKPVLEEPVLAVTRNSARISARKSRSVSKRDSCDDSYSDSEHSSPSSTHGKRSARHATSRRSEAASAEGSGDARAGGVQGERAQSPRLMARRSRRKQQFGRDGSSGTADDSEDVSFLDDKDQPALQQNDGRSCSPWEDSEQKHTPSNGTGKSERKSLALHCVRERHRRLELANSLFKLASQSCPTGVLHYTNDGKLRTPKSTVIKYGIMEIHRLHKVYNQLKAKEQKELEYRQKLHGDLSRLKAELRCEYAGVTRDETTGATVVHKETAK